MATDQIQQTLNDVYLSESRRVLATLIRLLGDFDRADEAMHEAFRAAPEQWPREGVPANPRAWLVSTGRFKAIDNMRRLKRFDSLDEPGRTADVAVIDEAAWADPESLEDDRLRLVFTCCHPALAPDAQVALTFARCADSRPRKSRAFETPAPTLAQRIVRAKRKSAMRASPTRCQSRPSCRIGLDAVLRVVYLGVQRGLPGLSRPLLTRHELSSEAIRLQRLVVELLLPDPEAIGLLALMLLQESRRAARTSPTGDVVLLDEQDRSLWNREQIDEGSRLVEQALTLGRIGPYAIQAAIAAVHAGAPDATATDWAEIVGLYDVLARADRSPVIELNRAAAIAMRDGPAAGLSLIEAILDRGELKDYRPAHAARAELCRRLGRTKDAQASFERWRSRTKDRNGGSNDGH